MAQLDPLDCETGISFISYGVRISIRVNEPTVLERLCHYLPPGWEPSLSPVVDELYLLTVGITGQAAYSTHYHQLYHQQEKLAQSLELEEALDTLDTDIRMRIAASVQDKLFVHAGVVGWQGRAIVIPGRSFSGKTTLVAAMIQAGATYYSDEYAVFDTSGLVHPYPRPLSVRQEVGRRAKKCSVEQLGGKSGTEPLPVGLVVHAQYESGAQWQPRGISPGKAVLALLDNTIVARTRPEFAISVLPRVVSEALAIAGKRGEAADAAVALLKQLEDWIEQSTAISSVKSR